jgi:hypothetical protein
MRTNAAIADQDTGYTAPVEKKVLDLIQRFNDPEHEHILQGIFQDTDGLEEISAKQQRASTTMGSALAELVALKTAVDYLKSQGRS